MTATACATSGGGSAPGTPALAAGGLEEPSTMALTPQGCQQAR